MNELPILPRSNIRASNAVSQRHIEQSSIFDESVDESFPSSIRSRGRTRTARGQIIPETDLEMEFHFAEL